MLVLLQSAKLYRFIGTEEQQISSVNFNVLSVRKEVFYVNGEERIQTKQKIITNFPVEVYDVLELNGEKYTVIAVEENLQGLIKQYFVEMVKNG